MAEQGRKTFLGDPDAPVPAGQRESNVPALGMQRLAEWSISKKKQDRGGLAEMVQLARSLAATDSSHWFDGISDEQIAQEYRNAVEYVNRQREEKYRNQFR
jgi:D-hexose-6-phosphate mutarotase